MTQHLPSQADAILAFYQELPRLMEDTVTGKPFALPQGVAVLDPFSDPQAWALTTAFYKRFYEDRQPRTYIFGINPGRFGGGVTGIPFTDPIRLAADCGIPNHCAPRAELSSVFMYEMMAAYGGPAAFYNDHFITAVSPLGFTRNGINLNYYDDKDLQAAAREYIIRCIGRQQATIAGRRTAICLGEGQNYRYFNALNATHGFFDAIIPLPHPRWIMQYRRKTKADFIQQYITTLRKASS
jgi:hypothetical protein